MADRNPVNDNLCNICAVRGHAIFEKLFVCSDSVHVPSFSSSVRKKKTVFMCATAQKSHTPRVYNYTPTSRSESTEEISMSLLTILSVGVMQGEGRPVTQGDSVTYATTEQLATPLLCMTRRIVYP